MLSIYTLLLHATLAFGYFPEDDFRNYGLYIFRDVHDFKPEELEVSVSHVDRRIYIKGFQNITKAPMNRIKNGKKLNIKYDPAENVDLEKITATYSLDGFLIIKGPYAKESTRDDEKNYENHERIPVVWTDKPFLTGNREIYSKK